MNHVSIFDPPLAGASWPGALEIIGAIDVFEKPFQGQLLRAYGVIPVHHGDYDRPLLTRMVRILERSPEGVHVRLALRRQDIADLCGARLETAIRAMRRLGRMGAVRSAGRSGFVVDPGALARIARGD